MLVTGCALLSVFGCGSGVNPAAVSTLDTSASSLVFGQVTLGTTASQQVKVTNAGTTLIGSITAGLDETNNFAVTSTCGAGLAAGASCTLTVTFQPRSAGALNAAMTVQAGLFSAVETVSLSGVGTTVPLPQATLSPGSLLFPVTIIGESSTLSSLLTNTGTAPLVVTNFALSDATDFNFSSVCGTSLAPGASCSINVSFLPQADADFTSTLTVTDNGGGITGSTQAVALIGQGVPTVTAVANFGDSITCGVGASPATNGYSTLFDTFIAEPAQNLCRSGDQAADTSRLWVEDVEPALGQNQLFTLLIGTNDANACGPSAGCLLNYSNAVSDLLAWLALPRTDKFTSANITQRSGAWFTDINTDLSTTSKNATLDFAVQQVVAGRALLLGYQVVDPEITSGGAATVSVDGTVVATLRTSPGTGHVIATQNGTHGCTFLAQLPLGAVGTHNIHIQVTSDDGAYWSLMWAGVSSGNYASVLGAPRVLVGGVPETRSSSLNTTVGLYNVVLTQQVAALQAQGLNIRIAPTSNALNPATDLSDSLHPNNAGHEKLAAAFESVL